MFYELCSGAFRCLFLFFGGEGAGWVGSFLCLIVNKPFEHVFCFKEASYVQFVSFRCILRGIFQS